ncbi:MAG TPA: hypothetical protein ENN65_06920, partial [Candidatus Hydrogenedentes bacterium]|nr:hypothetical protein [Candidatus Hydrogenedentota bacterium]
MNKRAQRKHHNGWAWALAGIAALGCLTATDAAAQIPIATIEDLQKIGNDPAYPHDGHYVLIRNIDASATAEWNSGAGFSPIGTSERPFTGVFDGQGHVITGLVINRPTTDSVGLFRYVAGDGTIRNLGLEGGTIVGGDYVGGLIGSAYAFWGTISVSSCWATGAVTGMDYVGGLIGYARASSSTISVSSCWATGAVTGSYAAGGLIGYAYADSSGDAISVSSCWATGAVTGSYAAGGLIGSAYASSSTISVSSCWATGDISGGVRVGGLIGRNKNGNVTECYATGRASGSGDHVGGLIGWNENGNVTE